jgi:hypothetical protein
VPYKQKAFMENNIEASQENNEDRHLLGQSQSTLENINKVEAISSDLINKMDDNVSHNTTTSDFINNQIDVTSLPHLESITFERLQDDSLYVR